MAIGMKLWFKKLAMNQTSRSYQRNEMINRRFPFWLASVYCSTAKSTSVSHGYHLNFVAKFLRLCNSALNPCIYFSCSESFCQGVKQLRQRSYNSVRCKRGQGFTSYTVNRNDALQTVSVKRFSTYCWENKDQTNQNG
ncbi:unnamed protein product, partial [Pocillopora meandrina]